MAEKKGKFCGVYPKRSGPKPTEPEFANPDGVPGWPAAEVNSLAERGAALKTGRVSYEPPTVSDKPGTDTNVPVSGTAHRPGGEDHTPKKGKTVKK